MLELRAQFPLATLLKVAVLPASTFYYQRKALQGGEKDQHLKARIRQVFETHKGRYGYRRVTDEIRSQGVLVNRKPVQRLMQELGLKSCVRVKKYRSYRGECGPVAPNILNRQFKAQRPNEKWVTDVTEFKVAGEKLYLSPVLDLCTGEIIAYETAKRPHFKMVTNMLKKAFARLGPDDQPLLHSDQGWHYRMPGYQKRLAKRTITQSMSRKGNCLDNAAMESFFGTLKAEFFHLGRFDSIAELEAGLQRYIHYYNHERIKLKLKGLSPVQYRALLSSI